MDIITYALSKKEKKATSRYLGSMTLTAGNEAAELAAEYTSPQDGDVVGNLTDNSTWRYSESSGEWSQYTQNTAIDSATKSRAGVVKIGDGINVSSGVISTNKSVIGLGNVDDIR